MQVYKLAKLLKTRGWGVTIVSMIPPLHFFEDLERSGVRVLSLHMRPGVPSITAIFRALRITLIVRPLIVHSHMFHANLLTRVVRVLSGFKFPLICTAHNIDETEGSSFRYWVYRLSRRVSSLNTNVSKIAFEHYVREKLIDRSFGMYIPNGVEIDRDLAKQTKPSPLIVEANTFVWVAAGRLVPAKDFLNLIGAVELLYDSRLKFKVFIAGEGPLFDDLQAKINCLPNPDVIKLLGMRKDLQQLFSVADSVVMSSAWEGLPMVLLEALALGKPIVATDVGGVSEVIGPFSGGELVAKSDPAALASAMKKLMQESSAVRAGRSHRAQQFARKFDIENVATEWEEVYLKIASGE